MGLKELNGPKRFLGCQYLRAKWVLPRNAERLHGSACPWVSFDEQSPLLGRGSHTTHTLNFIFVLNSVYYLFFLLFRFHFVVNDASLT